MKTIDVIVLNSHGVGQYAYTDKMPVWGETLRVTDWHIDQDGGKGTNVSCALGRLGIAAAYIGKVGNDPWGDLGEKWMNDAGVDTTYLYRTDEVATGTGLILIGPDGRNTVIDGDSSSVKLTVEEVRTAIDAMRDAKMLVTGFEIPEHLALEGARHAKALGMKTALNPSPLSNDPVEALDYVDYLFVNEVEGRALLDLGSDAALEPENMLQRLRERYRCGTVIATLGAAGGAGLDGDGLWTIRPAKVEKVVNTAGAGDAFMAATVARLMLGDDVRVATAWATYHAALSVTINGTIPAYRTFDEVEAFRKGLAAT